MNEINLQPLLANFQGTPGIIIKTLDREQCFEFNSDLLFPATSLIKLPILWEFFHQCANGSIDPAEEIELQCDDMVFGSGILRQLNPGLKLRLHDLAVLMTVVSDNTATDLLIDKLGMDNINKSIQSLGLRNTELKYKIREYFDESEERKDLTTPEDMLLMLEAFVCKKQHLGEYSDEPLKILKGQQRKHKLQLGIEREDLKKDRLEWANKTGDAQGIDHDAGILFGKEEIVIIVVMTKDISDRYQGIELCRDVTKLVYQNIRL
jgi:beta-lactamase class A